MKTPAPLPILAEQSAPTRAPWPEEAPSVSVNIDAGRDFSSVDVDPFELMRLLDKLNVPTECQSQMSLLIENRMKKGGGFYTRGTHETSVALQTSEGGVNDIITHEATHFIQDIANRLPNSRERSIRKFVYRARSIGMFASLNVILTAAHGLDTVAGKVTAGAAIAGATAGYMHGTAREYLTRPHEIEASNNEQLPELKHSTVTVVPR